MIHINSEWTVEENIVYAQDHLYRMGILMLECRINKSDWISLETELGARVQYIDGHDAILLYGDHLHMKVYKE